MRQRVHLPISIVISSTCDYAEIHTNWIRTCSAETQARARAFAASCGPMPPRPELARLMGCQGRTDNRRLRAFVRQFLGKYLLVFKAFRRYDYPGTLYPLIKMVWQWMNREHLVGRQEWTRQTTHHVVHAVLGDDGRNERSKAKQAKKRADRRLERSNRMACQGDDDGGGHSGHGGDGGDAHGDEPMTFSATTPEQFPPPSVTVPAVDPSTFEELPPMTATATSSATLPLFGFPPSASGAIPPSLVSSVSLSTIAPPPGVGPSGSEQPPSRQNVCSFFFTV
jgi:hypothetical protein